MTPVRLTIAAALGIIAMITAAVLYVMGEPGEAFGTLIGLVFLAWIISPGKKALAAHMQRRTPRNLDEG